MKRSSVAAAKEAAHANADHLLVPPAEIQTCLENISGEIARRAYDIFERRGQDHGRDWEDWLQAEREVIRPIGFELEVSPLDFIAVVYVEDSNPEELRISVEPQRLVICDTATGEGQKAADPKAQPSRPKRICFSFELPEPVRASSASAKIQQDKLLIHLPKALTAR